MHDPVAASRVGPPADGLNGGVLLLRPLRLLVAATSVVALAACTDDQPTDPPTTQPSSVQPSSPGTPPPPAPSSAAPPTASTTPPPPGSTPPAWLGTRVLPTDDPEAMRRLTTPPALRQRAFTLPDTVAPLPGRGFGSAISSPAPAEVVARSTWNEDCPVAADDLAWVRVVFHGFDGARHTGELLVHASVADDVVQVFHDLWRARFPIEEMRITTRAELDGDPTGDGNNTGAFTCRPVTGGSSYSEHAHGLAIDLNPFHNPYLKGDVVLPELARAFLDRDDVRRGMITADGPVVAAFARIGWGWGGSWRSLKDYQHFSARNR